MNPHYLARLRITVLLVFAVIVQTALGSDLRVAQVAPDFMVLLAICAGLAGGAEAGAWVGFWSGLLADMFLTTPLGLSALTYCLVGAGVGALRAAYMPERRVMIPIAALVATVAAVLAFVALGDMLGQSQLLGSGRAWLIRVAVVESAWNVVFAVPVAWLYSRMARGSVGVERLGMLGAG